MFDNFRSYFRGLLTWAPNFLRRKRMSYDVVIVDGNNMFYKAFSVYKDFSAFTGGKEVFTGGTYGLVNSILTLKRDYKPSKIVVAWDRGHAARSALYPEYKANRDKSDEEFFENFYKQMDMAKNVLKHLGIIQASKENEEADDVVGTLSRQFRNSGDKVLMVSADKDYQQLIDNGIDLLAHKGKDNIKLWSDITWAEMNGFHPAHFSIVLGLMGDTGDNIPGVPGIGEKGAYKLIIENFALVEQIIEGIPLEGLANNNVIPVKQTAAIKKLLANREIFRLSYKLAKINRHLKDIDMMVPEKDMEVIGDLFEMYQFRSLLRAKNWELLEEL
jgi:DNA polymerase I